MDKTNIKFMVWYTRIGKFIYGALFALAVLVTFVQLLVRSDKIFITILIDVAFAIVGVIPELIIRRYSERGTIYVETEKSAERFNLVEYQTKNGDFYVSETMEEYVVKLAGEAYFKSYKKSEVILEEDANIDKPVIEVRTSQKISKPADNEYSIFAMVGDKIKAESYRIIVKNKDRDIRSQ